MSGNDKFTHVAAFRPAPGRTEPIPRASEVVVEDDRLADLLGARIHRNHFGEHLSLRKWYATPEACSVYKRSFSLLLPQSADAKLDLECAANPDQWLFLDTETTGLAGGTGTYAFLVGIAWWDSGGLQVEQFFMRDLDEEHSVLVELAARMRERPILVTFNGKSFDWPLLETRYRMTRAIPFFTPRVHLDLLHPARQLWRLRLGSVRLRDLERHVLACDGHALDWSRNDDIDSSVIPQMYFDFLRGGQAEPLAGIFLHNQMDLRGLAALAGRIVELLDRGFGASDNSKEKCRDPIEALGLSRMLRRRGDPDRARGLYEAALCSGLPPMLERLAQRELAQLAKRGLDYDRAISLWEALCRLTSPKKQGEAPLAGNDSQDTLEAAVDAAEQLAIYYEHRAKQPSRALELVYGIIAELRKARRMRPVAENRTAKIEARLRHRFERLERLCHKISLSTRENPSNPTRSKTAS